MNALTIDGRALMPEFLISMTKGEELAFPEPLTRAAWKGRAEQIGGRHDSQSMEVLRKGLKVENFLLVKERRRKAEGEMDRTNSRTCFSRGTCQLYLLGH